MTIRFEIHIEALSVDGIAPAERARLAEAVRRALADAVRAPDGGRTARLASRSIARLDATATFVPGRLSEAVGASIARALSGGLGS